MLRKEEVVVVFDSGVGGLTALKEILKLNIKEKIIYLADNRNAPYGDKTKEQIISFVIKNFLKLNRIYDFKSIVLACNTASVYTKEILEEIFNIPVFSVTDEATKYLNTLSVGTIEVLATKLTCQSHAYKKKLPNFHVRELACPSFVPLVESDNFNDGELRKNVVFEELLGRATDNCPVVTLGCTHYPFLEEEIRSYYGADTVIINPSEILARTLSLQYESAELPFVDTSFYLTKESTSFEQFASDHLGISVKAITLNSSQENTGFKTS